MVQQPFKQTRSFPSILHRLSIWDAVHRFRAIAFQNQQTCDFCEKSVPLGFSDSITRTIWLLAHDAEYLPVATRTLQKAQALQQVAGRENCNIIFCGEILTTYFQTLPHPNQGLAP